MASVCYCVALRVAARKTTEIYDAALAPTGVNIAQFSLLRRVERAAPISLSELGRLAELDRSTVGRNVKVLQRMELVRVTPGADHREATVSLADKGRAVLRDGAPLWDEAQRRIGEKLGAGGPERLRELLGAL
ncbi:MAG: MarR family transcriptional regulator [Hyphomicrobiales bacterium]|nr:MarR family transcriptional regulator [Hyphomicrobiales bacterium]